MLHLLFKHLRSRDAIKLTRCSLPLKAYGFSQTRCMLATNEPTVRYGVVASPFSDVVTFFSMVEKSIGGLMMLGSGGCWG